MDNTKELKRIDKETSLAVFINGYYQRELVSTVLLFLTRYLHSVLNGKDPGRITLEVKAERLVGETCTLPKEKEKDNNGE